MRYDTLKELCGDAPDLALKVQRAPLFGHFAAMLSALLLPLVPLMLSLLGILGVRNVGNTAF
eukprot:8768172-Pyramimonas_sp.AAC.1